MVCVVGRMRDLILQLSKSSIYSTKPLSVWIWVLRGG
ncbi:ankyrin repeat domain-containing protein, partial [Salmonella enterica subsp. enterica serovar Havana]